MTLKQWICLAVALTALTLVMSAPFVDVRRLTDASYEGDSRLLAALAWRVTRSPAAALAAGLVYTVRAAETAAGVKLIGQSNDDFLYEVP